MARSAEVKAGEWDDNANFREFQSYLARQARGLPADSLAVSSRRFVVVRDAHGKAVPNCRVHVRGAAGGEVELTTTASGRALLFPQAEGLRGRTATATTRCGSRAVSRSVSLQARDGVVRLDLAQERRLPQDPTLDVVFVLDTTGSMSEEISALKSTITTVAETLRQAHVRPRLALVEYKDQGDVYITRLHHMTTDVAGFVRRVESIEASGGGDTPEHVNAGLRVAMDRVEWSEGSLARLAFLIGDAPPQLSYPRDVGYQVSMREANHRGIQIFTVAASGMDDLGQRVWRQIAQYTGGTNLFVLRGGAGPQSTGGGDPTRSCGGTHENYSSGNLAQLISDKVERSLLALESDPLRIAGLYQDERAKPCEKRIYLAR